MRIDPHVHCRDQNWGYKATIASTLELATEQGVDFIFDMPNNDPLTIDENSLVNRLKYVPLGQESRYFYSLGLTKEPDQIEEVVKCYYKYPQVIDLKLFAGKSVGDLSVSDYEDQRTVYRTLAKLGFGGVVATHCEKESLMQPQIWNPEWPETHCYARPKYAEIVSVQDQINLAIETDFKGILHICHISCWESVRLVYQARKRMRITCGVTPHHIMWDSSIMSSSDGLLYKMNPPLRDTETVRLLREYLCKGYIDWVETDHAPHTENEKMGLVEPRYPSGYPSLTLYKQFVEEFLPNLGLTSEQIYNLTYRNIVRTFDPKLRQAGIV
jgi:dihydroorotase